MEVSIMKGIIDMYQEVKGLGKVIASHTTADGIRAYVNVGEKQIIRVDLSMNAKKEVEALLRQAPFFAVKANYKQQKERK
jgi:hypothetical protein